MPLPVPFDSHSAGVGNIYPTPAWSPLFNPGPGGDGAHGSMWDVDDLPRAVASSSVGIQVGWGSACASPYDPVVVDCGKDRYLVNNGFATGVVYVPNDRFPALLRNLNCYEALGIHRDLVVRPVNHLICRITSDRRLVCSVDAYPPSIPSPPSVSSFHSDYIQHLQPDFDNDLLPHYGPDWPGRQPLPANTPMYNKFVSRITFVSIGFGIGWEEGDALRNIRTGSPAIRERLHVGEVVRHGSQTYVHNMEGCRTNTMDSSMRICKDGHHQGKNCHSSDRRLPLPLPSNVRIVYLNVRKLDDVQLIVLHFARSFGPVMLGRPNPLDAQFAFNHCHWVDLLVVRGRCSCSHKKRFRYNRAFEGLFWHWAEFVRPLVPHKEGNDDGIDDVPWWLHIVDGDPVPAWLDSRHCLCNAFLDPFCQCNLSVGRGFHHPGGLYSNALRIACLEVNTSKACLSVNSCKYSSIKFHYPRECCNTHCMNDRVASKLASIVVDSLSSCPPPVPHWLGLRAEKFVRRGALFKVDPVVVRMKVLEKLKQCKQRRSEQPRPKRIAWEKRPKWNGSITNLTSVVNGLGRAQSAVASAVPATH